MTKLKVRLNPRKRGGAITLVFKPTVKDKAFVKALRVAAARRGFRGPASMLKSLAESALRQWGEMPEGEDEVQK